MTEQISLREFLNERHQAQMKELAEIKDEVRATNGRLRAAESRIIVLSWGYGLGAMVSGAVFVAWVSTWWGK